MKIRIDHPTTVRLACQPGDEISVQQLTPELAALLHSPRLDGQKVAHLVGDDDEELAVMEPSGETAVIGRARRGQRTETVPR